MDVDSKPKITVIDALCGAGKTTYIFDKMNNSNPKDKWIFVSPYLNEAGDGKVQGRIQKELPSMSFRSPAPAPSKTASFLRYVQDGRNVAITHSLFSSFTVEAAEAIKDKNYHLVIDETIDLINFYDSIEKDDIKMLIENGVILTGKNNKLEWNNEKYPNYTGRDSKIKELCDLECLWLYGDDVMIQRIPPLTMRACKTVTILTYMFEGSLMRAWLKLNNMGFSYEYPEELKPAKEIKQKVRESLNVIRPPKVIEDLQTDERGLPKLTTFSANWYDKAKAIDLMNVKSSVESTLKHNMQTGAVFWTTFKNFKTIMEGKGYSRGRRVKGECGEKESTIRPTFVSKNMRASNEYRDCTKCIYMVNVYPNVSIVKHLNSFGVNLDVDRYALSELVQFMFRGCIRMDEEMDIYILSNRMRQLLLDWLDEDV